jgi:hypothetical protein
MNSYESKNKIEENFNADHRRIEKKVGIRFQEVGIRFRKKVISKMMMRKFIRTVHVLFKGLNRQD